MVLCDKKGVKKVRKFTAIIEKEGRWFIAQCPELDIASQGKSVKEAQQNLREAVELFFRHASPSEIANRLKSEVIVTQMVVSPPGSGHIKPEKGFHRDLQGHG